MRSCTIPGCTNRVRNPRHWTCPACHQRWCKDGTPAWLRALIAIDGAAEHAERARRGQEVSLEAVSPDPDYSPIDMPSEPFGEAV